MGEEDSLVEPVRQLAGAIKGKVSPVASSSSPGLNHDFPADFTERAGEAVRFLLK